MFEKVKEIIVLHLEIDEVTMEDHLENDLGADSLDKVEIVTQVEDAFDIEIDDENYEKIKYVKDIVHYLERNVK